MEGKDHDFFFDSALLPEFKSMSGIWIDSSDGRSDDEKLGDANVDPASLFAWLMEPGLTLPGKRAVASASSLRKASTSRSNLTGDEFVNGKPR